MILNDPVLELENKLLSIVIDQAFPFPICCKKFTSNTSSTRRLQTRKLISLPVLAKRRHAISVKQILKKIATDKSAVFTEYIQLIVETVQSDAISSLCREHVQRYLLPFCPQSKFEFDITTRYQQAVKWSISDAENVLCIVSQVDHQKKGQADLDVKRISTDASLHTELCVNALSFFSTGEIIENLVGYLHEITADELAILEATDNNFSVLEISASRTKLYVLLGPARFINHDCSPNAKGSEVVVQTTKPIKLGEEIFISYGTSYFDSRNSKCLCKSCEKNGKFMFLCPISNEPKPMTCEEDFGRHLFRARKLRGDTVKDPLPVQFSGHATDAVGCPWRSLKAALKSKKPKLCQTCHIRYSDYGPHLLCERCNRHWLMYGSHWPLKTPS